jgi:hypothetical protein
MHPYIATGPNAVPAILTVDARVSLAYLARQCLTNPGEAAELTQRTFGDAYHCAWPAWEHDVLVRLVQQYSGIHRELVVGLAAAVLSRANIPATSVPSPFAELLQSRTPVVQAPTAPTKRAKAPQKPSALQQLMGGTS